MSDPARDLRPSRLPGVRDMEKSAFAQILADLLARIPGAFACALVDELGETVDYAGAGDPFDVKVAAAHLGILFNELRQISALGEPNTLVIRGEKRSLVGRRLPEGYALVVLLRRRAGFAPSSRAFSACERALASEAGWPGSATQAWFPVEVAVDGRGRPVTVGLPPLASVVLGAVVGLAPREKGFRVRLETGSEVTLVREPGRIWYADESVPGGADRIDSRFPR